MTTPSKSPIAHATESTTSPVLNPYDWAFHDKPYPIYQRLREEAPLYHDELFRTYGDFSIDHGALQRVHPSNVRGFSTFPMRFIR